MPEKEPRSESDQQSRYLRAARYDSDDAALNSYDQVQELVYTNDCDISCYRIRYRDVPFVVLLGIMPQPQIEEDLSKILSQGEEAKLPQEVISRLAQRRKAAEKIGPWTEGHYRPGISG